MHSLWIDLQIEESKIPCVSAVDTQNKNKAFHEMRLLCSNDIESNMLKHLLEKSLSIYC